MTGPMDRVLARMFARPIAAIALGISMTGCASYSQSVDAYYRQMASNYADALKEAKIREIAVEKQAKILAATGDSRYHKYERELKSLRKWQEHCAWEQQRFEKAANWMEAHLVREKKDDGKAPELDETPERDPSKKNFPLQGTAFKEFSDD
ncbi:MAG: hypothetical protein ACYC61_18750 [Isosphaeraceae bacterium]